MTIDGIINRFSPKSENDTELIIDNISNMTGIKKNKILALPDYPTLIQQMAIIESGKKFPLSLIKESITIKN